MKIQVLYPLCLRCGSLAVRSSLFCRNCEVDFLLPRVLKQTRLIEAGDKVYNVDFLLQWNPKESDCLSELVYLLKNPFSFSTWKFYVEKFIQFDSRFKNQNLITAIVPVPGSHFGSTAYHTKYFAQAWQNLSHGTIISCLTNRPKQNEQKGLTLNERREAQLSFHEDFTTEIHRYERIILVDDIVTSGYTLQASLMALKPHLHPGCVIEIKALLSRGKI